MLRGRARALPSLRLPTPVAALTACSFIATDVRPHRMRDMLLYAAPTSPLLRAALFMPFSRCKCRLLSPSR